MSFRLFSQDQNEAIDELLNAISHDEKSCQTINHRIQSMISLLNVGRQSPSILKSMKIGNESRSVYTLIESLCKTGADSLTSLPTRAVIGYSLDVYKMHFFSYCIKTCEMHNVDEKITKKFFKFYDTVVFSLLIEEIYRDLLSHESISIDLRSSFAKQLAVIWEHRVNRKIETLLPMLNLLWNSRKKLTPIYGTMSGFYEMYVISGEMPSLWIDFIASVDLDDDKKAALHEFLFGIRYEEIEEVNTKMIESKNYSLGKEDLNDLFLFDQSDARSIFRFYRERKQDAIARLRFNIPGPKHTIEELLVIFIFERSFN